MSWLNRNQKDEQFTFIFDKNRSSSAQQSFSDDAGACIDILAIIINQEPGVKELQKTVSAFQTQTYGLISALIPLFLKK